jgi:ribonuclease-3
MTVNMLDLHTIQDRIGVHFHDQSLLLRALTHPSFLNENPKQGTEDNQRLEYLGDAVLDFICSEWLYHRFPEATEGRLTRLRASLVRTETLAALAADCSLNEALLLGKGEEENGGRKRPNNLCAAFEAYVGALFLDQGIQAIRDFVKPLFDAALEEILHQVSDKDPKSLLQEWAQAHLGTLPSYKTINSSGPDHAKQFTVAVFIGNKQYAVGIGPSKQAAAQLAARQTLNQLSSIDFE